ncbi:hypothetical protein AeRB84_021345 [Aphanomyces euteiches]|nr:hypothetical protein AeRB84_021345 [Aphanomyces euteiches]
MKNQALMIKSGVMNGKVVKVLIDSGATNSLCRLGLGKNVMRLKNVRIAGYDGVLSQETQTIEVKETIHVDFFTFKDTVMTEWDLKDKAFDVILDQPWFRKFNPVINWRKHEIESIDDEVEVNTVSTSVPGWIIKLCHFDPQPLPKPPEIVELLEEFKDVFPAELPDQLPPKRAVQFDLQLKPDAKPQNRAPFRLAKKGWVELSTSDWVSNIFGVPKKDENGKLPSRQVWLKTATPNTPIRWVLDYRHVNSQTEIPKIPLPNFEDLFNNMHGCTVFTKIDLASGYHQMLVEPHARKYTAFRTHKEILQWCVAPMGLAGMPGIWSRLMRCLFDKFPFVVVYLDDICVHSKHLNEHVNHLRCVLEVLRKEKLYARMEKCAFVVPKVDFLGHTISAEGLQVDSNKVRAIEKWSSPTNRKELLSFLGMAGYYRKFIANYANLVLPMSDLTKDSVPWNWSDRQEKAFLTIKAALQQAPVLQLPNKPFMITTDTPFMITTDASGYCCGAVLSQQDDGGNDRPVAFLSKKLGDTERNWPSHEKELYAIKLALTKWRPYVYGSHFDVFTDNSTCQWFLKTPILTAKLTRWLDFFGNFDFTLHHRPGKMNVVADALSRPPRSSAQVNTKSKDQVWRLCVPDDDELKCEIISQSHDTSTAAHPGARRTQLHIAQWYYWKGLEDDVKLYVATCETCARYKSSSAKANCDVVRGIRVPNPICV